MGSGVLYGRISRGQSRGLAPHQPPEHLALYFLGLEACLERQDSEP